MEKVNDTRMLKNFEEKNSQRSANEGCGAKTSTRFQGRNCRKVYLVGGFLLLVGGIFCVLGGLYASKLNGNVEKRLTECNNEKPVSLCEYSDEAKRVQIPEFLSKVRDVYYKLYPEQYAWEINVSEEEIKKNIQER